MPFLFFFGLDVIHVNGPFGYDHDHSELANCYFDSLSLATKKKIRSIVSTVLF